MIAGGQEVRLPPLTQQGKLDTDAAAKKDGSAPEASTAQDAGRVGLPGSPRLPGTEEPPRLAGSATQAAMDHKRAFQAVNAETLELASQNIDYPLPPHKVRHQLHLQVLWLRSPFGPSEV